MKIIRPWLQMSILKLEGLKIPGLRPQAWSTGELNEKNQGMMPVLTDQLVLARNISVFSKKFSQTITDHVEKTDWSTHTGLLVSTQILVCGISLFNNIYIYSVDCSELELAENLKCDPCIL